MPKLFIITGSNGAGKSSIGADFLPEPDAGKRNLIFNGDEIYTQKAKEVFIETKVAKIARNQAREFVVQQFNEAVDNALKNSTNFYYEGHFSNENQFEMPIIFKEKGYEVHFLFFGLNDIETSINRVKTRVREGGHHVSVLQIEQNFSSNMVQIDKHLAVIDYLTIINATHNPYETLVKKEKDKLTIANELPKWLINGFPKLLLMAGII